MELLCFLLIIVFLVVGLFLKVVFLVVYVLKIIFIIINNENLFEIEVINDDEF